MPPKKGTKKAATTKCKKSVPNRSYFNLDRFVIQLQQHKKQLQLKHKHLLHPK